MFPLSVGYMSFWDIDTDKVNVTIINNFIIKEKWRLYRCFYTDNWIITLWKL